MRQLISPDALAGLTLGISVSQSDDLCRLGLLEIHFRLALGELARLVVIAGGNLAYGGHLQPYGYTAFLMRELERYSRRDRPLRIFLAWSEHRKMALSTLGDNRRNLGLYGEITCLDLEGQVVDPTAGRDEIPPPAPSAEETQKSLSGLRLYMAENTHARILIGGKRRDFQGQMPGLLEEAIFSLERGHPLYLAGGFGGMTLEIARALGIARADWPPAHERDDRLDDRVASGLSRVSELAAATERKSIDNGLTEAENRALSMTYRPSEIAALVGLGLARRFAAK